MQKNVFLLLLLTAAVITANHGAFVTAAPIAEYQRLRYEIVENRPLPQNTSRVVLSGKSSTSAGYVKITVARVELAGNRKMEQNIQIFDKDGNAIHSRQFKLKTSVVPYEQDLIELMEPQVKYTSKYGNYFILRTINRHVSKEEDGLFLYELFDENGNKKWGKEFEIGYESGVRQYVVSDVDGSGIKLVGGATGTITFYSSGGTVLKEIKEINGFDLGNGFSAVFSEDGRLRLVNVIENGYNREDKYSRVIMFNESGEELWRFEGDNYVSGQAVGISPDNNYILTSDYTPVEDGARTTYLLDGDGNLLKKFEGIMFSKIVFSSDSKTAVINSSAIIDLPSGQILRQFGRAGSFDIASEKKLVAVMIRNRLFVNTFDGSPVFTYRFGPDDIFVGNRTPFDPIMSNPAVQISDDGSEIFVSLGKRIVRFRLQ